MRAGTENRIAATHMPNAMYTVPAAVPSSEAANAPTAAPVSA